MGAAIIFLIIFLFIGLGVGAYFLMKSSKKCPDNCSDSSCSNNTCTTCSSGYGIDNKGAPDTDGSCPVYTSCPNCGDDFCKGGKCSKCSSGYGTLLDGTPDSSGSCPPYYIAIQNLDYLGQDLNVEISSSNDDCIQQCIKDSKCEYAIRRDDEDGNCYRKENFVQVKKQSGTTDAPHSTYLGPVGTKNP